MFVFPSLGTVLSSGPTPVNLAERNIVYDVKVGETVRLDDRVIHFSRVIYDRAGRLYIFYSHRDVWFRRNWGFSSIGTFSDDLGNTYSLGSGGETASGLQTRAYWVVTGFSPQARTLYITFDQFNRRYEVRIPLPAGDGRE